MKTLSHLLALGFALLLTGCGQMLKSKPAAEQAVVEFHKLYNDGKLPEIYAASHNKLKSITKETDFLDFVGTVHKKLGKMTQTSTTGFNVKSMNLTTTVVLTQNTTFENGTCTETFTYLMDGEKAVLAGYHINSKDLIMK
jgi:hypothetical protein